MNDLEKEILCKYLNYVKSEKEFSKMMLILTISLLDLFVFILMRGNLNWRILFVISVILIINIAYIMFYFYNLIWKIECDLVCDNLDNKRFKNAHKIFGV